MFQYVIDSVMLLAGRVTSSPGMPGSGLSRNRGCVSRVPGRGNPGQLGVPESKAQCW